MTTAQPDMETIKARMKATWMAGDFGQFSKFIEAESEKFMSRRNLQPGIACLTWPVAPVTLPSLPPKQAPW
ncbi:MAG: hypothetical protein R3E79_14295 [Caldilineaceae bacterium]